MHRAQNNKSNGVQLRRLNLRLEIKLKIFNCFLNILIHSDNNP